MNDQEVQFPSAPSSVSPEKRTPRGVIAALFFGTYLSPFAVWIFWLLISGGGRNIEYVILNILMIALFPSGLLGFVCQTGTDLSGKDLWLLAGFGYIVYAVVFALAFSFRKYQQTCFFLVALLVLIVLNAAGCRLTREHFALGNLP